MMMWRWRGTVLCCAVVYCIVWGNAIRFIDMGRAERPSGWRHRLVDATARCVPLPVRASILLSHIIIIAYWCSEPGLNDCIVVFCAGIPMLSVRLLRKRYLSHQREHALRAATTSTCPTHTKATSIEHTAMYLWYSDFSLLCHSLAFVGRFRCRRTLWRAG